MVLFLLQLTAANGEAESVCVCVCVCCSGRVIDVMADAACLIAWLLAMKLEAKARWLLQASSEAEEPIDRQKVIV